MRIIAVICVLLLAVACQQIPDASIAVTASSEATEEATPEIRPTDPIDAAIGELPPPGTAVIPVTEDPSTDLSQNAFTIIFYEEQGGLDDTSLVLEIHADGRVVRNGVESQITPAEIARLTDALIEASFFNLQGVFTQPGVGSDVYSYALTVTLEDGSESRIDAQDGYTPPELQRLFSAIRQVGATPGDGA